MRSSYITITIAMILLVPSLLIIGQFSTGEKIDPIKNLETEPYSSVSYDGLELKVRSTQKEDVDFLKLNEGVAKAEADYNPNIDGSGTGLAPPTSSEWDTIGSSFNIIDDVTFATPTALNTSKYHNSSNYFPPIGNQGSEGSCVSWSIGYYTKTFQEAKEHGWNLSGATYGGTWPGAPSSAHQDKIMSPDFLYHQTNDGVDGGSYYSDAIFLTQRTGISSWKEMPYDDDNHTSWPAEDAWREAPLYRTEKNSTYYMYTQNNASITNLKTWIDGDQLATISINAYRYSSLSGEVWNNTVACGTGRNHANTIVGYDDNFGPYQENGGNTYGAFLVANSWGKGWSGDTNSDGMYWISYECMRLKVQYVYLMADRIDYEPKIVSFFNLSHSIRDECTITLGIGSTSSPTATKERFDNALYDGGSHPFPSNLMAFDITDFSTSVSTFTGYNYFLKIEDGGTSTTGSIQDFSIELYDTYSEGPSKRFTSDDPVVTTVNGGTVYAEVVATDNIPPRFINDGTVSSATTGDPLNFTVVISDNGLMDTVFIEYWNGSGPIGNLSMAEVTSDTWFCNITAPHTIEDITYRFHANDTGNNWNETGSRNITMSDNDIPQIIPTVPTRATTGDPFNVEMEVIDNIEVEDVVLEHWYDTGSHTNVTMTKSTGNNWTYTLNIDDRLGKLHLVLKADDPSDNQGRSGQYNITIEDDDLPLFTSDLSDVTSTTGESFTLSAEVTDNIDISSVWAQYWNDDGFNGNTSMIPGSLDTWTLDLDAPDSTEDISYTFHFNDTSDNWNSSSLDSLTIVDNDLPVFSMDISPSSGTTGEEYTFQINILDNIEVREVYLEYWFGEGAHTNVSLTGPSPYSYQITIPDISTDQLQYVISAVDPSSNWNQTTMTAVTIIDNDLPTFGIDSSTENGTTGDEFHFDLSVVDNIGIQEVFVEYWFGFGAHINSSMIGTGPYGFQIEIPYNSTEMLHYFFSARDLSDNWNSTIQIDVTIVDNDLPIFSTDSSQEEGTTGDHFQLNISVSDNMGVISVYTEFWFGTGPHQNVSLSGVGPYTHEITIPFNSIDPLYYRFSVVDPSDNWNTTSVVEIIISDDDRPILILDHTQTTGTTGDPFELNVEIEDNIQVQEVWVRYCFGDGDWSNVSMVGNGTFILSLMLPEDSLENLSYMFDFCDTSGNWNNTEIRTITILDNDFPIFWMDHTPYNASTGEVFTVSVEIIDNIGLMNVILEYWFGEGGEHFEDTMFLNGSYFSLGLLIPMDSIEDLHYIVKTNDTSGLKNSTEERIVNIFDIIDPEIIPIEDVTVYLGSEISISITASDNVGIVSYSWEGAPIDVSGLSLNFIPSSTGTFHIIVNVMDHDGNSAETDFTLIVLPVDNDHDKDGIPDLVEDELGLDSDDPTDAAKDNDEDGLTNLEEYLNGTKLDSNDTDEDGMPDKWEIDNGLDPVISSAENDKDEDGISDLDEYLEGTDPLVTDLVRSGDDDDDNSGDDILILIAGLIAAIVLIIIVVSIFLVARKVKKNKRSISNEEVMDWN